MAVPHLLQNTPKTLTTSIISLILGLFLLLPAHAQSGKLVAFMNNSGQLVVASADGNLRWIVTNPGETLHPSLGYTWSPNGDALFFALQTAAGISLRIGIIDTQTTREIAIINGALSGGEWTEQGILIAQDTLLHVYQTDGSVTTLTFESSVQVVSPYAAGTSGGAFGNVVFAQGGSLHLLGQAGNSRELLGSVDGTGLNSVLWSTDAPLLAYSAFNEQNNSLLVVAAENGETFFLSSGRSTPITPVAWHPGTTQLLYYGADYQIQIADVGCVLTGCGANPLETGTMVLPASAEEIHIAQNTVFFRDGEQVRGVRLACVTTNTCLNDAFTIGTNAVTDAAIALQGDTLFYTAYAQDAFNPADRNIWRVDIACLPECAAQPFLSGAINGALAADGTTLIVDIVGVGLHSITLADGRQVALASSGAAVAAARWHNG